VKLITGASYKSTVMGSLFRPEHLVKTGLESAFREECRLGLKLDPAFDLKVNKPLKLNNG